MCDYWNLGFGRTPEEQRAEGGSVATSVVRTAVEEILADTLYEGREEEITAALVHTGVWDRSEYAIGPLVGRLFFVVGIAIVAVTLVLAC